MIIDWSFYEYLYGIMISGNEAFHGISLGDSMRAPHYAVQKLRLEQVPLQRWVPFVHLGK
jgi:hypothetical protein